MNPRCLGTVGLALAVLSLAVAAAPGQGQAESAVFEPWPLTDVRLGTGAFKRSQDLGHAYLLEESVDCLLSNFRANAGIPTTATPLGGWEAPDCELRGHFTGHFLAALAQMYEATGDARLKEKALQLVAGLAACQEKLGGGYLSAFPESFIDRVVAGQRVWAPWYTLHKILAGLIETRRRLGSDEALTVAMRFADWVESRLSKLDDATLQAMLENEFGGMAHALADLAALGGRKTDIRTAQRFHHRRVMEPLQRGEDRLRGLHANTQVPKMLGAVRLSELEGDSSGRQAAVAFFDHVVKNRTYANGGTSNYEYWRDEPGKLASELSSTTAENCVTHNMIKLARALFSLSGEERYADYDERALWNGVLGTHHPEDAGTVMYYVPLRSGLFRMYSARAESYVCCSGTGIESWARFGEGIYYRSAAAVTVNLYVSSTAAWPEKKIRIVQDSHLPESGRAVFTIEAEAPTALTLRFRIPRWAVGAAVLVNGTPSGVTAAPGSYADVTRTFATGDKIEVLLPMSLRLEPLPDRPTRAAVFFGPTLLAAALGSGPDEGAVRHGQGGEAYRLVSEGAAAEVSTLVGAGPDPSVWLRRRAGAELAFETFGVGRPFDLTLKPFHRLHGERYAVYLDFRTEAAHAEILKARAALPEGTVDRWSAADRSADDAKNLQYWRAERGEVDGLAFIRTNDWMRWDLEVLGAAKLGLRLETIAADAGRPFSITIDGIEIARLCVASADGGVDIEIPKARTAGRRRVAVCIKPLRKAEDLPEAARPLAKEFGWTPRILSIATRTLEAPAATTAPTPTRGLTAVPFENVRFDDPILRPRIDTLVDVGIDYCFDQCEKTGRTGNFRRAAGLEKGEFEGDFPFNDSDVLKVMEGAAYVLGIAPSKRLDEKLDQIIAWVAAAQEKDGYLYTARTLGSERLRSWFGKDRYEKEQDSHELYNAGHLFEAAVAHARATGKRNFLDVAVKLADRLAADFGPGRIEKPSGHQGIEIGLAKLAAFTGDRKYLRLAEFLLMQRGNHEKRRTWGDYCQDHLPVFEQVEARGHAVRAAYMYTGMADVGRALAEPRYVATLDRVWENVVGHKLYVTGAIGATGAGEAFGENDDLPNASAYCETCASMANVFWSQRMFLAHGDARYVDVLETALLNAVLSGLGMDGKSFFYTNPLATYQGHPRRPWFGCSCCPTSAARFVPALGQYAFASSNDELFVALYAQAQALVPVGGENVAIDLRGGYPYDGKVTITVAPGRDRAFALKLRLPGWATGRPLPGGLYAFLGQDDLRPRVEGSFGPIESTVEKGFLTIRRTWSDGDRVTLDLPMPVRRVLAKETVAACRNRMALQRGPLVYAFEAIDTVGAGVHALAIEDDAVFAAVSRPELLGGVTVLEGPATAVVRKSPGSEERVAGKRIKVQAIPYYAWSHRGNCEMSIWMARTPAAADPEPWPTPAHAAKKTASHNQGLVAALSDQMRVENSADKARPFFHWWPKFGSVEWVQYDFAEATEVSGAGVYWLRDIPNGGCDVPKSWRILALSGDEWRPVEATGAYETAVDRANTVGFKTVKTRALRLEVQLKEGLASGIHEWSLVHP